MATKSKKEDPKKKGSKEKDPEKEAKRKARMEALKNRPAEQRPGQQGRHHGAHALGPGPGEDRIHRRAGAGEAGGDGCAGR